MSDKFDFLDLAKSRFSVRKFIDKPVEQGKIDQILQAGYLAPTARNNQPQKIYVINTPESARLLQKCTPSHFNVNNALIVCYDKNECYHRDYDNKSSGEIDASIVATHMMLEAASIGIGSTWVMHFMPNAVKEEFKLPENIEPVAILVIGYAASDAKPSLTHNQFKPLSQLVEYL